MNVAANTALQVSFPTSRFGQVSVAEDRIIQFVHGMPGFERLRRFVLIDHDQEGMFRWLQSAEDPGVAFLLTDPCAFKPGFSVPLKKGETEALGASGNESLLTLVMV